jgi:hypothetical protein
VRVFRKIKAVARSDTESDGSRSGDPTTATATGQIVRRFEFNKDGSLNKNYYDYVRPVRVSGVQGVKNVLFVVETTVSQNSLEMRGKIPFERET